MCTDVHKYFMLKMSSSDDCIILYILIQLTNLLNQSQHVYFCFVTKTQPVSDGLPVDMNFCLYLYLLKISKHGFICSFNYIISLDICTHDFIRLPTYSLIIEFLRREIDEYNEFSHCSCLIS